MSQRNLQLGSPCLFKQARDHFQLLIALVVKLSVLIYLLKPLQQLVSVYLLERVEQELGSDGLSLTRIVYVHNPPLLRDLSNSYFEIPRHLVRSIDNISSLGHHKLDLLSDVMLISLVMLTFGGILIDVKG